MMINGVPVVTAPAEITSTTAEQLRVALLHPAACRQPTVVVDLTRTRTWDPAGLAVLVRAHTWAMAEGSELRLVIPYDGTISRIFAVTGLDRLLPLFGSLDEALAPRARGGAPARRPTPGG